AAAVAHRASTDGAPPAVPVLCPPPFFFDDDAPASAGPYPRLVGEDRDFHLKGRVGADGHRGWLGTLADELCGQGGAHHAVIGAWRQRRNPPLHPGVAAAAGGHHDPTGAIRDQSAVTRHHSA